MNYLDLSDLIRLHDEIIVVSGGLCGVRDTGVLESILAHVRCKDLSI